jgi:uncharacterized protein
VDVGTISGVTAEIFGVAGLRAAIASYRDAVTSHAPGLNRLNVYPVPDGDTGTNMARTLDAVVAELERTAPRLEETCRAISHGSLMGARGNSGVILSQLLRGMVSVLVKAAEIDAPVMASAFREAATAAYAAVLKPVEGTILTVAREAGAAAERAASAGGSLLDVMEAASRAGREALERTPELLPVLKQAGVVDAGGAGFVLFLDAFLHVLDGRPLPEPPDLAGLAVHPVPAQERPAVADLRYEVMFLLDLPDERMGEFKGAWAELGDSIVVVGGDGEWSCHIHTDDIGGSIEAAILVGGRPNRIQVTDLAEEAEHDHQARIDEMVAGRALPAVTTGVVAVASGPGLDDLFTRLGVQVVVRGGQTANPSTAELLAAVEAVNAAAVVVLPNNKNIVPVAEQVPALSTKQVVVLPTRSMPEGLAALVAYRAGEDVTTNAAAMRAAADLVEVGEVTLAVRDVEGVRAGDWIGLLRDEGLVAAAPTLDEAATALLDTLVNHEHELLTVIEGVGSSDVTTKHLLDWVLLHRPGLEVDVHRGGQPHYPYLFGAE